MPLEILPSIVVTLFVILGVILGALFGLLRGFKRSIVTILGTIVSAVLAFFLAIPIASFLTDLVLANFDISSYIQNYDELVEASPAIEELIEALPAALIAPILFMALFIVLKLIMKIPCGIISCFMGKKSELRAVGMPIGAVQGLISSLVFVFVITGLISVADNVTTSVLNDTSASTAELRETVEIVDKYIDATKKDPIVGLLCTTKTEDEKTTTEPNAVFSTLSTFEFRDKDVKLNDELINIADTALSITPIMANTDISKWTDTEIAAIEKFADNLNRSEILINLGTDLVSGVSKKWANNEAFLGIERPKINDTIDPLLFSLFVSLQTTTTDTIREDIDTIVDILKTFYDYKVLENFSGENASNGLLQALSGDFVSDLLTVLSANDRFNVLVPEVANLGLRLLASALELPENSQAVYQDTVTKISDSLSTVLSAEITEESITQFSNDMKDTLSANGINISDEISTEVANAIVNNFANETEITPEKIEEYFRDFATIYEAMESIDSNQTGKNNSGISNLTTGGNKNVDPRSTYNVESMSYDEKLQLLSGLGLYDHYCSIHDISNPNNVLSNGKTASEYVTYIVSVINTVGANYDNIGKMGTSKNNPMISLGSPDTLITTKVTASDLLVGSDMKLSTEDIQQFGKSFESITTFIDSYSKLEGDLTLDQLQNLDIASAGKAMDLLKSIPALSNTVDKLSNAVVGKVVGTNVDIASKIAEGNTSYEELFVTVKSTAQVLNNITSDNVANDQKEEAILDLLINLTPGTASVVNEIITVDLVTKYGAPKDSATAAVKALRVAFTEMANLTGEQHEEEASYITRMFELSVCVRDDGDGKDIIGENGMFKSEDELIDMSLHSKVAAAALKAITTDENGEAIYDALNVADKISEKNKENIANTLENIYNENKVGMTADELVDLEGKIIAVSHLLKLDIDFIN